MAANNRDEEAIDKTIATNDDATLLAEESGIHDTENLEAQLNPENRTPDNLDIHRGELAEDFVGESEEETQNIENEKTLAGEQPEDVAVDKAALRSDDSATVPENDKPFVGGVKTTISGRGEGTIWPFTESDDPNKATEKVEGSSSNNQPYSPADEGAQRPFDHAATEPAAEPVAAQTNSAEQSSAVSSAATSKDAQESERAAEDHAGDATTGDGKKAKNTKKNKKQHGKIRTAYHKYQQTKFYKIWDKRIKFSYAFYALTFLFLCWWTDLFQIWSVNKDAQYDPLAHIGLITQIWNACWRNVAGTAFILNFIALALIYAACVTIINRFWVATAAFTTLVSVFAVANKIKITLRNETIIPSDLTFISGGAGESIISFIPPDMHALVYVSIKRIVAFIILCILLQFIDKRRAFIYCSWKHPLRNAKNIAGTLGRILAAVLSVCLLITYSVNLSEPKSAVRNFANNLGYSPALWDTSIDAQQSGSLTTFLSLTKVKAMNEPKDYSRKAMQAIADKYAKEADIVNAQRAQSLTNSTVIFVLSESFSDPTRVPGVSFTSDPIPFVRSLSESPQASTGLMISPSYGGGTANIEYQQLTGMSMANFNDSLLSPYQQLIPNRSNVFTFNQMWNEACGGSEPEQCSIAYHPYFKNLYMRASNYVKFKFSNFRTLDSVKDPLVDQRTNPNSGLVQDEQSYQDVIDGLNSSAEQSRNMFVQLITMQNHLPYNDWYADNQFKDAGDTSENLTDAERRDIETYAKGAYITDEATQQFLNELNQMDRPISVVFYGDHLPGIYPTAMANPDNNVGLHETNYFIWSNQASRDVNKLPESNSGYSSANFFMAQAAEQLNAKVSPFLTLLSQLHAEVPAMARFGNSLGSGWTANSSTTIVDAHGNVIPESSLSDHAKQLLEDYKLVQYDMAVGKNYLGDMKFTSLNYNK